ncbi:MAG: hypothetical protein PVI11_09030 [Candidatus Aminicenantes bacterium]|jgi:uncharacterized protein with ATP-grasp and redox domains
MKASRDCCTCFFIQTLKAASMVPDSEETILQMLKDGSVHLSRPALARRDTKDPSPHDFSVLTLEPCA